VQDGRVAHRLVTSFKVKCRTECAKQSFTCLLQKHEESRKILERTKTGIVHIGSDMRVLQWMHRKRTIVIDNQYQHIVSSSNF